MIQRLPTRPSPRIQQGTQRNEMMMSNQTDLIKRLESGYSLPALSVIAIRLVELAADEECSVNDLVSLIEKIHPSQSDF